MIQARTGNCHVDRALCIIHERYGEPSLSLKAVSEALYISAQHLGRLFKRHLGEDFRQHLRVVRIQRAADLLATSTDQIKTISALVGYSDQSHFGDDFRKLINTTPSAFRAARQVTRNQMIPKTH